MRASIDGLTDKLMREVKEYSEKRRREPRRRADHNGVAPSADRQEGVDRLSE
jgi:ribosome-associated translation inhibitor RaiA